MNTPGMGAPRRGSTSGTQGPLALPVATTSCTAGKGHDRGCIGAWMGAVPSRCRVRAVDVCRGQSKQHVISQLYGSMSLASCMATWSPCIACCCPMLSWAPGSFTVGSCTTGGRRSRLRQCTEANKGGVQHVRVPVHLLSFPHCAAYSKCRQVVLKETRGFEQKHWAGVCQGCADSTIATHDVTDMIKAAQWVMLPHAAPYDTSRHMAMLAWSAKPLLTWSHMAPC